MAKKEMPGEANSSGTILKPPDNLNFLVLHVFFFKSCLCQIGEIFGQGMRVFVVQGVNVRPCQGDLVVPDVLPAQNHGHIAQLQGLEFNSKNLIPAN